MAARFHTPVKDYAWLQHAAFYANPVSVPRPGAGLPGVFFVKWLGNEIIRARIHPLRTAALAVYRFKKDDVGALQSRLLESFFAVLSPPVRWNPDRYFDDHRPLSEKRKSCGTRTFK
jgi:hypothetical protein